ncbi:hypothetical protein ISCGN_012859, partial [Ixodes scapularis]
LGELKELVEEAEEKKFPPTELLQSLKVAVQESEKTSSIAQQLLSKKVRTRNRQSQDTKHVSRLTLDELQVFYEQLCKLPCVIRESVLIKDLVDRVLDFQTSAQELLGEEMGESRQLEKLLEAGVALDMDLVEVPQLKHKLNQARWLEEVKATLQDPTEVTLDTLRKLLDAGVGLAPHPVAERAMAELQELLTSGERWEEKAKTCLQAKPRHSLPALEALIAEASEIPVFLPNLAALKEATRKASEWSAKAEAVQVGDGS